MNERNRKDRNANGTETAARRMPGEARFITLPEYAGAAPVNVFHRQLDKRKPDARLPGDLHILFRDRFSGKAGNKTVIRVTADDHYKMWVNGRFAGQGPAPCFPFRTYVNEIDVTPYVKDGENAVAFHVLYQGLVNRVWVSGDDRTGLWYEIRCGGRTVRRSGEDVRCRIHTGFAPVGKAGYDTQFMERYDSRSPEAGFERADYDDSAWGFAAVCEKDDHSLTPQPTAMLAYERVYPAAAEKTPAGNGRVRIGYDFGAHYVGTLEASASGKNGDTVTLRFGQEKDADGRVRYHTRSGCDYEEEWILSGGKDLLDEYDYKSFRYAEIEAPEDCDIGSVSLLARHYPFRPVRTCGSADPDLKRIWDLCERSLKYGVQEVIQDCMDREKGQYLGDGSITSVSLAVLTGDLGIMEKMVENAFDTAFINKGLMTCSPCSHMQEIAEYVLMLPHVLRAHALLSGKSAFASRYYPRMAETLDFFRDSYERENGLLYALDKWCVVDWPAGARDGYDFDLAEGRINPGTHSVINAYYIGAVRAMNALAKSLGLAPYRSTEVLEKAYLENFYDPERLAFRDIPITEDTENKAHCALPSSVFALCFGLCPDRETEQAVVGRIMEAPAERMAFFGTFAALAGLKRLGEEEKLRRVLRDGGRWLRMLREGADSTFEAWGKDLKWNTSLFHLCYTYPVLFLCDWGMEKLFC